jgi:outer membrane biosynthesis protein TonB
MSRKSATLPIHLLSCGLVLAAGCSDMPREAARDTPLDPSAAIAGRRPIPPALRAHTGLSHLPEPADRAEFAARLTSHYPAQFRAKRVSGTTLVDVHVDAQGRVGEVEVVPRPMAPHQNLTAVLQDEDGSRVVKLNDRPEFGAAAQAALRETPFLPALKDGKPVAYKLRMTVQFDPPAVS